MKKRRYTDQQVLDEASYIINKSLATYRETAERFNMPLSTVGWHMKVRLKSIDSELHSDVMDIVHINYRLRKLWRS
jgi:hypothetical protein|nr:MAG TPA: Stage III sporulation protein D [Caudoviricetes sp.]